MTILVFDSGIGGLTVLREARILLPEHRFVYFADDAAFPYGDWEENALVERMLTVLGDAIEQHQPEMVIVACNTASTLVLPHLRKAKGSFTAIVTPAVRRYAVRDILSAAPKAAIEQLVKGLAAEEGRFGVRANAVGVGVMVVNRVGFSFPLHSGLRLVVGSVTLGLFAALDRNGVGLVVFAVMAFGRVIDEFRKESAQKKDQERPAKAAYDLGHRHCVEHVASSSLGSWAVSTRFHRLASRDKRRDQTPFLTQRP